MRSDVVQKRGIVDGVVQNQIHGLGHGDFFNGGGKMSLVGVCETRTEQNNIHIRGHGMGSHGPGPEEEGFLHPFVGRD